MIDRNEKPRSLLALTVAGVLSLALAAACNKDSESPATGDDPNVTAPPPQQEPAATDVPDQATPPAEQPATGGTAGAAPAAGGDPAGAAAAANVDDQQLEQFATAYREVEDVQQDFEKQLQGVSSQEEAQEVQQKAVDVMRTRIESTGMPFEEYARLAQQIQTDPRLQDRLEEKLEDRAN